MSEQEVKGRVEEVRHIGPSKRGISRFAVILADGRLFRTEPNGGVNFEIGNYRPTFSYETGEYERLYCEVTLKLNGNKHIVAVEGDDSFTVKQKFAGFEA